VRYEVEIGGRQYRVDLVPTDTRIDMPGSARSHARGAGQSWLCRINGREVTVDATQPERDVISLLISGKSYEVERERVPTGAPNGEVRMAVRGVRYVAEVRDPRALRSRKAAAARGEGPRKLVAPMPGKIIRVVAAEGTTVEAGQSVLVIEAMKMQNEIKSPKAGVLRKFVATEGMAVNAGDVLAIVE
jgi:biotin carboxyl carrier protein